MVVGGFGVLVCVRFAARIYEAAMQTCGEVHVTVRTMENWENSMRAWPQQLGVSAVPC